MKEPRSAHVMLLTLLAETIMKCRDADDISKRNILAECVRLVYHYIHFGVFDPGDPETAELIELHAAVVKVIDAFDRNSDFLCMDGVRRNFPVDLFWSAAAKGVYEVPVPGDGPENISWADIKKRIDDTPPPPSIRELEERREDGEE